MNIQELQAQLQERHDVTIKAIEKRDAEIEEFGKATRETAELVNQHAQEVSELRTQLEAIETLISRGDTPDGGDHAEFKTLGQSFVESDVFAQYSWDDKGTSSTLEVRDVTITTGLAKLAPSMWGGLVTTNREPLRLINVIPVIPTDDISDFEYVRELRKPRLVSKMTAAVIATATVIPVANVGGYIDGQTIEIVSPDGNTTETRTIDSTAYANDALDDPSGTITVTVALTNPYAAGSLVYSDHFGYTPEGYYKPAVKPVWADAKASFKVVAAHIRVSRQAYRNSSILRNYIDAELPATLLDTIEFQLLNGAGGNDITGFLNDPEIFEVTGFAAGDTRYDRLRKALAYQAKSNYRASVVVMNHDDWCELELEKGNDDHYVHQVIYDANGQPLVWSMQVIPTNYIPAGKALMGNFDRGCFMLQRETLNVMASDSHEGDFLRNQKAILAETEHTLVITKPDAFVTVDLVGT
jgi:hypothetical protein